MTQFLIPGKVVSTHPKISKSMLNGSTYYRSFDSRNTILKKFLLPVLVLVSYTASAQWTASGTNIYNSNSGNVGIGTTTPSTKLDVNGAISSGTFGNVSSLRGPANSYTNLFLGGGIKDNSNGTYTILGDGGSNFFSAIKMDNGGNNSGAISFYDGISVSGVNYTISNSELLPYMRMSISGSGNVGIGIANPQNKLDVNGTIHARAALVNLNGWADNVFKKGYQLRPLSELKTFVENNQHLPEVPSETELMKSGLNVSEMNKLLMKKIEEMTLYMIEKDEQLKQQTYLNKLQDERIRKMQKQIDKLIRNHRH
jgi:hypothetical protein